MTKLTDYADAAATEYLRETGKTELEPHWLAEFFQDCGVLDEYPRQDLVAFHAMVQKELIRRAERTEKQARLRLDKIARTAKPPHKP
ncbi:hypothetical protein [Candidatus Ferrigenium straubiae]|jgi:hypothetical protein|uniref:hypothetical protein n=1 Tax=Candidatus Ferrigenium straubiae TaxID=2919506 RepID=UPI003F4A9653